MHPEKPVFTCEEAEARFSAHLENDLPESENAALEAHLETCGKCREGYEQFREAVEALQAFEADPAPEALTATVLSSMPAERKRIWPLWLAWTTAAAAASVAVYAFLSRPEPVTVTVPVERRVVVEREVPVHKEVKVPISTPVSVAVEQGSIELVRNTSVHLVDAGDRVVIHEGDTIRIVPRAMPETAAPPRLNISVDLHPLAAALQQAAGAFQVSVKRMAQAATAMAALKEEPDLGEPQYGPLKPAPPVALVWGPGGTLVLETAGPDHEVVPQLIGMLDHDNPQVRAVAQGRLASIQERLHREHGISAPDSDEPAPEPAEPDDWSALTRLFKPQRDQAPEPMIPASECWRKWWQVNREMVACLALSPGRR